MNKLIVSIAATAALIAGGAAWAQDGGAEAQAGSAWRNNNQNNGYVVVPNGYAVPQSAPNARPDQGPRTSQEYYGNSGWTPPANSYAGVDAWGRPIFYTVPNAATIYQPSSGDRSVRTDRGGERHRSITRNARPHDRDGDGVPDHRDRHPDDSRRW